VQAETQAFDVPQWQALATADSPVKPGDQIVLGFDGAVFHDSTGLVATHVKTGYQWVAGVWERPYGPAGEEWSVPEVEVDAVVRDYFKRFKVWRMYADPPYWQSWIATWAGEFGAERVVEFFTNRRRQMAAALENFDTAIKTGGLSHDGDTRLRRHIANSRRHNLVERDEQGKALWLIRKERPDSPMKIDLAMAAVLSWEVRTHALAKGALEKESVYATRGVLLL
jgi:phage terminase large subunit-like protein